MAGGRRDWDAASWLIWEITSQGQAGKSQGQWALGGASGFAGGPLAKATSSRSTSGLFAGCAGGAWRIGWARARQLCPEQFDATGSVRHDGDAGPDKIKQPEAAGEVEAIVRSVLLQMRSSSDYGISRVLGIQGDDGSSISQQAGRIGQGRRWSLLLTHPAREKARAVALAETVEAQQMQKLLGSPRRSAFGESW